MVIVASVSCIYGLGSPIDYQNMVISLRPGMEKDRDDVIKKLIEIQYDRNDMDFKRGTFRVKETWSTFSRLTRTVKPTGSSFSVMK